KTKTIRPNLPTTQQLKVDPIRDIVLSELSNATIQWMTERSIILITLNPDIIRLFETTIRWIRPSMSKTPSKKIQRDRFINEEYEIDFDLLAKELEELTTQVLTKEQTKYVPLNETELKFYSRVKLLLNNNKTITLQLSEKYSYLVIAIRSNESKEYLQQVANKFQLNLEEAIKATKEKYQLK
ncbi:13474_t:CDS:2, partial [Ambispora leptoticha]